jgi:hypothetical protein
MKWLPPPGPQRRRQLTLLALMIAALGILLWRYVGSDPAAQTTSKGSAQPSAPVVINTGNLPQAVDLGKLEPVPEIPENGRNLFRFGERPQPPPPKPQPAPPPPPPIQQPPPGPVGPPPIQLKLIGITNGGDGRPVAVLKDPKTGATFMGNEGMIVDGQYKIIKVGITSAVLSYVDGQGQRTIPLGSG